MELLLMAKELLQSASVFEETNNYYFQNHTCQETKTVIKVHLDCRLMHEKSQNIVNFGMCPHCKTLFYHNDKNSSSL